MQCANSLPFLTEEVILAEEDGTVNFDGNYILLLIICTVSETEKESG